ncbi:hypothetical protein JCM14076_32700 [Methylosoma difficile]
MPVNSKDKDDSQAEHLEQTFADRLAQIIGVESVASFSRRSGIRESLLRKYLNGSLPTVKNLVILADAGATSIGWLASGRTPQIAAEVLEESTIGNTNPPAINDELQLLICYRQADKQQKAAIRALLVAFVKPSGIA